MVPVFVLGVQDICGMSAGIVYGSCDAMALMCSACLVDAAVVLCDRGIMGPVDPRYDSGSRSSEVGDGKSFG
jgi:hypothetical protein